MIACIANVTLLTMVYRPVQGHQSHELKTTTQKQTNKNPTTKKSHPENKPSNQPNTYKTKEQNPQHLPHTHTFVGMVLGFKGPCMTVFIVSITFLAEKPRRNFCSTCFLFLVFSFPFLDNNALHERTFKHNTTEF